jgi:hypothetical protein
MDKAEFVTDADRLWFLESTDVGVDEVRAELGRSFGFQDREWYKNERQLNTFLESIDNRKDKDQFLYNLKDVATNPERQKILLTEVVTELNTAPAPPPAPPTQAKFDPAKPTPASGATANTATAPPRKSVFKSGPKAESADAGSGGSGPVTAQPAPAAPAPPPQRSSIFKAKKTEPAAAAEPAAAGPGGEEAEGVESVEEIHAQIDAVVSELSPDEFAEMAKEVGISPDELRAIIEEPNFADLVAEEQAKLA